MRYDFSDHLDKASNSEKESLGRQPSNGEIKNGSRNDYSRAAAAAVAVIHEAEDQNKVQKVAQGENVEEVKQDDKEKAAKVTLGNKHKVRDFGRVLRRSMTENSRAWADPLRRSFSIVSDPDSLDEAKNKSSKDSFADDSDFARDVEKEGLAPQIEEMIEVEAKAKETVRRCRFKNKMSGKGLNQHHSENQMLLVDEDDKS